LFNQTGGLRRFLRWPALVVFGLAGLGAQTPGGQPQPAAAADAFEQTARMRRGVNIIGYDPIWKDFAKARFKERHFARIHEGGFQTVRVNLQAFAHMNADHKLDPAWLKTLDWVVENALANNLTVILDEHDFLPCAKDAAGCRSKLLAFWEQIAPRYQDAPANVLFELLNEPHGQLTAQLWNALLKDSLAVVRQTNPTRNVVVGPAVWNTIGALGSLELPADDRHIIVTVPLLRAHAVHPSGRRLEPGEFQTFRRHLGHGCREAACGRGFRRRAKVVEGREPADPARRVRRVRQGRHGVARPLHGPPGAHGRVSGMGLDLLAVRQRFHRL